MSTKAWAPDPDFDLHSEMETGYTIAEGRGNLYSIGYSGRSVHTVADLEHMADGSSNEYHQAPEDQAVLPCPSLVGVTVDSHRAPRHPRI